MKKKLLITLGIVILLIIAVFVGVPAFENPSSEPVEGSADWMSRVSGNISLSDMNIPGSHDSTTEYVQLSFFSKCQGDSVREQLDNGVRYLDVRLGMTNDKLALMHGFTYCKKGWWPFAGKLYCQDLLQECYEFLEQHPTETILFVVKQEHGDESVTDFQNCLNQCISENPDKWLFTDTMPTLEAARGKLVLFRRYEDEAGLKEKAGLALIWEKQNGSSDTSLDVAVEMDGSLWVQDRYEYNVEDKWQTFVRGCQKENEAKNGAVKINFLSTKGSLKFGHPYKYSSQLNKRFLEEEAPEGWTVIDFVTAELAQHIYSSNQNVLYGGLSYDLHLLNEGMASGRIEPIYSTLEEEKVYTFLQGPKSWENQETWSGEWSEAYLDGGKFGAFGCGMCCMANIYDTLSDHKGSPLDAYTFAREMSAYAPTLKTGAIGWGDLKNCLRKMGMECDLYYKPDTYEEFQAQMTRAKSAIVLVSSRDDDSFWTNTKGHYVNIWLYDRASDKVFLAEPGSPDNNRSWIPLRYVYDALKTLSKFQYIRIDGYDETKDRWMPEGITDEWIEPETEP